MNRTNGNWICLAMLTLLGVSAISAQAVTSGLVGYYDFENDLLNKAGAGNHMTVTGGSDIAGWTGGVVSRADGDSNRVILLVGNAGNYVDIDNDRTQTPLGTAELGNSFSISAWHNLTPNNANTSPRFFVFEASDNFDVSFGISSGDTYNSYVGQSQNTANNVVLPRNVWHHVLHTFSSDGTTTTLDVYVNGAHVGSHSALTSSVNFADINIGRHRSSDAGDRDWDGLIDEVAIWNRPLTAGEAAQVHTRGLQGLGLFDQATIGPIKKYVVDADGTEPDATIGATITLTGWSGNATFAPVVGVNNDLGDAGFTGEYFRTTGAGANAITIALTDLAPHSAIDLGMFVAQIDSLDPFRDGDRFIVKLDGVEILNVGFSYGTSVNGAFTDGSGSLFASTGDPILDAELLALRTNSGSNLSGDANFLENVYDLSLLSVFQNIAHSSSSLTLEIIGRQNQPGGEFYGVDNITISLIAVAVPEPATVGLIALAGMAMLRRRRVC